MVPSMSASPGNRGTFAFHRKQKKIPAALKEVTESQSWRSSSVIAWQWLDMWWDGSFHLSRRCRLIQIRRWAATCTSPSVTRSRGRGSGLSSRTKSCTRTLPVRWELMSTALLLCCCTCKAVRGTFSPRQISLRTIRVGLDLDFVLTGLFQCLTSAFDRLHAGRCGLEESASTRLRAEGRIAPVAAIQALPQKDALFCFQSRRCPNGTEVQCYKCRFWTVVFRDRNVKFHFLLNQLSLLFPQIDGSTRSKKPRFFNISWLGCATAENFYMLSQVCWRPVGIWNWLKQKSL